MSGITGIFRRDGRDVNPVSIKKMNDKIAHRGPDGSRTWCEGPVAFGHQMLHTTRESLHEILPFEDEDSGLVITADARIDNRKELAPQLGIEDNEYVSDSYYILKAYEKWGEKCPEELLGDFSFAIWDKNNENLFCARDHMGIKPLYYFLSDELFIFGSEIKSILINIIDPQINDLAIAYSIGLGNGADKKITCYEKIFRLPCASLITINLNNEDMKEYWKLDINRRVVFDSDKEYERAFRDIFIEAIRCRMRSVFPIGSMLSGGLDSSSISCTAQKILKDEGKPNLQTFSAVFDSVPQSNERGFIEKVLAYHDFDAHFIKADEISPLEEINSMLWYRDQPLLVPNTFMTRNIYREAAFNGVRVMLDGFDGDIIVSHGKGYLTELIITFRWFKFIKELIAHKKVGVNIFHLLIGIISNIMPRFLKRKIIIYRENNQKESSKTRIVNKNLKKKLLLTKKIVEMSESAMKIDDAHKKHYLSLKSGLLQWEMELLDSISIPFNVEQRHPFYDIRLIEFCLAIPTEQKLRNGWDRSIMRRALSGILPESIQWRKSKGDISFNFKTNFLKERNVLDDQLFMKTQNIERYVEVEVLNEIYRNCITGNRKETMYLWLALVLSLWLDSTISNIGD